MEKEKEFFYCNATQMAISPYDFSIKLLKQIPPDDTAINENYQPITISELTIIMSPGHAKAMLIALHESVTQYESLVGPITLPIDAQKAYDEKFKKHI